VINDSNGLRDGSRVGDADKFENVKVSKGLNKAVKQK